MLGSAPTNVERVKTGRSMWSPWVLAKYWALQLPATALLIVVLLGLGERLAWPPWMVWTITAVWVAKDAILYPLLWRSYDFNDPGALPYPIHNAKGIAVDPIDPSGTVRIWGEIWRAELSRGARRIEQGEAVRVKARHRLTLFVEAEEIRKE